MLRVKSFLNFSGGSMGETTFMKINGKHTAREKVVVNKKRYEKEPRYGRTRENSTEFGHASSSGKTIRSGVNTLLTGCTDSGMVRRLQKELGRVILSDQTSERGKRNIKSGDIKLLLGFNFNIKSRLRGVFNVGYTTQINPEGGELTINIPSFKPTSAIKPPEGTTHFKIVTAGLAVNFNDITDTTAPVIVELPLMPWDNNDTVSFNAVHTLTITTGHSVVMVLGLQFFQESGKWIDRVKGGSANCLAIVDAG